jgi:SOS response regulatory protein OraA/RecX
MAYWETVERLLLVGKQDKAERELMDMGFSKTTSQEIINDYEELELEKNNEQK